MPRLICSLGYCRAARREMKGAQHQNCLVTPACALSRCAETHILCTSYGVSKIPSGCQLEAQDQLTRFLYHLQAF